MLRNRQCWRSFTASYLAGDLSADLGRTTGGSTPALQRRTPMPGGLTYRPVGGARSWVHFVHVASLDDAVADAERLGAVVLQPRTAVPKTAWYAVLADPEGNIFAIYQEDVAAFGPAETET